MSTAVAFAGDGDATGKPTPSGALRLAFWFCYDHLGKLLLLNVLVFLPVLCVAVMSFVMGPELPTLPVFPTYLVGAVWLGAGMAALLRVVAKAMAEGDMKLSSALSIRTMAFGAIGGILCLGVGWAFVTGAFIYGSGFLPLPRPMSLVLSGLTAGTGLLVLHLLLWCGAGLFIQPGSPIEKLKWSVMAIVMRPDTWLTVWVLSLLWAIIAILLWPLVVFWSAAPMAVLLVAGHVRFCVWNPLEGCPTPQINLHENRTMRDFWFPWKN